MTGQPVGIIGAGAWGTALASVMAQNHDDVLLWALEPEVVSDINANRRNSLYLPSAELAPGIRATGDLADAAQCQVLLLVTPAQHLAAILGHKSVSTTKRLVEGDPVRLSEIVARAV